MFQFFQFPSKIEVIIIIIIIVIIICEFFTPALVNGLSLESDSKSTQISRTLLSILTNLKVYYSLEGLGSSSDS